MTKSCAFSLTWPLGPTMKVFLLLSLDGERVKGEEPAFHSA
jgi:hypothetical protein